MGNHIAINASNATVEASLYLGYPALRVAVQGTEVFFVGDLDKFALDIAVLYPSRVENRYYRSPPASLMRGERIATPLPSTPEMEWADEPKKKKRKKARKKAVPKKKALKKKGRR
jgi:hypothetical protein